MVGIKEKNVVRHLPTKILVQDQSIDLLLGDQYASFCTPRADPITVIDHHVNRERDIPKGARCPCEITLYTFTTYIEGGPARLTRGRKLPQQ